MPMTYHSCAVLVVDIFITSGHICMTSGPKIKFIEKSEFSKNECNILFISDIMRNRSHEYAYIIYGMSSFRSNAYFLFTEFLLGCDTQNVAQSWGGVVPSGWCGVIPSYIFYL